MREGRRITLRTCTGTGCDRVNDCQRARDHGRDALAERFPVAPYSAVRRTLHSDGRVMQIREQACEWFKAWV